MTDKKSSQCNYRSSYDDYINTLNKLAPSLRSLLSHISGEQAHSPNLLPNCDTDTTTGGAVKRKKTCSSKTKNNNPSTKTSKVGSKKKTSVYNNDICKNNNKFVQAVTNNGKIVYGTVSNGKLDVHGSVGEVHEDLLGIDTINAGKPKKSKCMTSQPKSKTKTTCKIKRSNCMKIQENSINEDCCPGMD
ncbi:virion core protein [Cetacean poxvirus 1]|nr:virion core protein [Cetacean poxvirus 1]